jgi:hypothetical protein
MEYKYARNAVFKKIFSSNPINHRSKTVMVRVLTHPSHTNA